MVFVLWLKINQRKVLEILFVFFSSKSDRVVVISLFVAAAVLLVRLKVRLLYKIDLSVVSVGHLPVVRQRALRILLRRMAQVRGSLPSALRGGRRGGGGPKVGWVTPARAEGSRRTMSLVRFTRLSC